MSTEVSILLLFLTNTIRWYRTFLDTISYIYACWKIVFDGIFFSLHL